MTRVKRLAVISQVLVNIRHVMLRQRARRQEQERMKRRRKYQTKNFWTRPWLTQEHRLLHGHWDNLLVTLRNQDVESFFNYLRMPPAMFDDLLLRVEPLIAKKDTNWRKALPAGLKLAVTLRYMASGDKYATLAYDFRISRHTICSFIPQVCNAIYHALVDEVMDTPTDPDSWKEIAEEFRLRWNVPHAVGALDGKHIAIRKPRKSGSMYYNYKGYFSVVLMALVDADYKFIYADVGGIGHQSDAQIWNASELKEALDAGDLHFPEPDPMPHDNEPMPYLFIGDDAFAMKTTMMKPYSQRGMSIEQRIYNYRISRARRVVENAFGILANRFQVFLTTMQQEPEVVFKIIKAAVCLHNLMRIRYPQVQNDLADREDENHRLVPGAWRQDNERLLNLNRKNPGNVDLAVAKRQREVLCAYFNSEAGSVPWQRKMITL